MKNNLDKENIEPEKPNFVPTKLNPQNKGNYSGPTVVKQSTFSTPMGFVTINVPKFATFTDQSTVYVLG